LGQHFFENCGFATPFTAHDKEARTVHHAEERFVIFEAV